jgi:N-acetylglucosamine kinase-like BadF-type ATPase
MTLVLGVDGGNSKTLALLADETGRVLGAGRSGGSNYQGIGIEAAMREIRAAADCALRQAGVAADQVDYAFYALSGADLDLDFQRLQPALANLGLAKAHALDNDTVAALFSGTDAPNAVGLVLGAGINAAGRNAAGTVIRFPSLGWVSGDWGGGGDLAREMVRAVAREWDGRGVPTLLTELVLAQLGLPDGKAMIAGLHAREIRFARLLELVPLVFVAADRGDATARELIFRTGDEAGIMAVTLLRRLDLLAAQADVVLGGSLFRANNELLLTVITDRVEEVAPDARLILPEMEPAAGAVLGALEKLGIVHDGTVRARLTEGSREARGTWTRD